MYKRNEFYKHTHGAKYMLLSENLQKALIEYLFAIGVRPEIGLCVEYLSWNKD